MTKLDQIKESIQIQLGNFVATEGVKIPLQLILENRTVEAINVFPVESIEEAEGISLKLTGNKNIENNVKNINEPLFLTVIASLPNVYLK